MPTAAHEGVTPPMQKMQRSELVIASRRIETRPRQRRFPPFPSVNLRSLSLPIIAVCIWIGSAMYLLMVFDSFTYQPTRLKDDNTQANPIKLYLVCLNVNAQFN